MSALSDKMAAARVVAGNLQRSMIASADALIAKGEQLDQKRQEVFGAHNAELNNGMKELAALERELTLLSNEPPPLPESEDGSPTGEQPVGAVHNWSPPSGHSR